MIIIIIITIIMIIIIIIIIITIIIILLLLLSLLLLLLLLLMMMIMIIAIIIIIITTTTTTTIIIIIIIITFRGAVQDFLQSLAAPRTVSNAYTQLPGRNRVQITCNTSSANHVQLVVLSATWYEGTAQLLSLTELKSHLFEFLFYWLNHLPMKEGRKPEYPETTPGDELQEMPHTKAQRFKPLARLEPAQQHW